MKWKLLFIVRLFIFCLNTEQSNKVMGTSVMQLFVIFYLWMKSLLSTFLFAINLKYCCSITFTFIFFQQTFYERVQVAVRTMQG